MTIIKIGLLSPYNGGNLGDGAIQDAVIWNLKERCPDVQFIGITENPIRTRRLHHIDTFPLSVSAEKISAIVNAQHAENKAQSSQSSKLQIRKITIRRILVTVLRPFKPAKKATNSLLVVYREIVHALRAYKFLRQLNVLVVAGGGQLDETWGGPWAHPYNLFKWAILAKLAGTHNIMLSVGASALQSRLSRFFVKSALSNASYHSFRDIRTVEVAQGFVEKTGCHYVPDLAFSYPAKTCPEKNNANASLVIGVSPMVYCDPRSWPRKDAQIYGDYVKTFATFVFELLQRGHSVVLFTSALADKAAVTDVVTVLNGKENFAAHKDRLVIASTETVSDLLQCLCIMDLVVASRLHAVILSHVVELPVVAVSYDKKVNIHMRDMDQNDYCLDIGISDADAIVSKTMAIAQQIASIRPLLRQKLDILRSQTDAQYDEIAKSYCQ